MHVLIYCCFIRTAQNIRKKIYWIMFSKKINICRANLYSFTSSNKIFTGGIINQFPQINNHHALRDYGRTEHFQRNLYSH